MKRRIYAWFLTLTAAGLCLGMAGCGVQQPSIRLVWGDVLYESSGDHALKELDVTRTMADGTKIRVKVGTSDSKEVQATLRMMDVFDKMADKIPSVR